MSNYRRSNMPGGTYFFTLVTHNRKPLFSTDRTRKILHRAIADVKERRPFKVEAICLLPDHIHTVWRLPVGDSAYPQRWNEIKGIFTKHFRDISSDEEKISQSRQRKGEGGLWQRRFWEHLIRDENDLKNHMDYLHFNPVKHRLVDQVVDWPWSSFHSYVKAGIYPVDWGGSLPAKMNLNTTGE
ncbi:MAG: transposase [Candidatus Thiodiazotropha sp. 6PLUC2]